MPNRNSKAGHKPMRTCVVCKKKVDYKRLLNFFIIKEGLVFDVKRRLQLRKFYLCPEQACIIGLEKWKKRRIKRVSHTRSIVSQERSAKEAQA